MVVIYYIGDNICDIFSIFHCKLDLFEETIKGYIYNSTTPRIFNKVKYYATAQGPVSN